MNDDYAYTGEESAFVPTPSQDTVNADEFPQQPVNQQTSNPQQSSAADQIVGKRYNNPLSALSSYTYNLSLYMITPDAYDVFVKTGRKDIEIVNQAGAGCGGGAYLIARSGGINNETMNRAPGFHYDFYIDNLVIESAVSATEAGAPAFPHTMIFTITEHYGFSFINNLKRAKDSMDLYSTTINIKDSTNTSRQFFVIGIEFLGYDSLGNVVTGKDSSDTFVRYYDILFRKINFKIDGRATTYNIEAVVTPTHIAMGQKRGVIDKGANQLTGTTVGELCNALMNKLNKDQNDQVPKDREFPNIYKIEFMDDAKDIEVSSIVTSSDVDKTKWPMAIAKNKTDINTGLEIKAQANNQARILAFNKDTPIIQAIQQIVNQSEYLINGLKSVYNTDPQPNKEGNKEPIDSNKRAKWFNISPLVSEAKFDRKLKDFAYTITYQIRTYETPVVLSTAVDNTAPYYGPFKRYEYWLTGQNSEVIKYEQTMNNAFFTVAVDAMGNPEQKTQGTGGNMDIPVALGKRTPVQRLGKLDIGMEAQNNYVTSLVDPGAYARAEVQILGDPDLLPVDMPTGNNELDNLKQPFYGPDGYSLDPRRGQVYIEIDFKEAVDYEHDTGVLRVNDKIVFWEYPPEIQKKVKGIAYLMTKIKSVFRGGKFTQDLSLTLATFGDTNQVPYSQTEKGKQEARETAENESENKRLQMKGNAPVGLIEDKPVGSSSGGDPCGPAAPPVALNQETNNKGVADDDANPNGADITGEPDQNINGNTINSLGAGA